MGARSSQPGALEGAGKGRGRKQSLRERSERSPIAPQAPENLEDSRKLREENQKPRSQEVEKSKSWKVGRLESWLENPELSLVSNQPLTSTITLQNPPPQPPAKNLTLLNPPPIRDNMSHPQPLR